MSRITVRLDSVRQWFPSGVDVPPLLAAFGRWLDAIPHGTLGYFDALAGASLDESFVRDPATLGALRARLGIFLLLPEGSRLALWDYGGPAPAVVWIGSEGGQRHVAATLEDFLIALSAGATGVSDLDDRDASAQRGALAEWLASQGVVAATNPAVTVPDFAAWFSSGGAIPTRSPGPTGPSSLDDLSRAVETLCGRTSADAEVVDLLGRVGHWPLPPFEPGEDLYVEDKQRGFCILLKEVTAGGRAVAVLSGCFFYSEGKDGYRAFAHELPRGIAWSDDATSLVARLGPPKFEHKSKKSGKLIGHRWQVVESPMLSAHYAGDGKVLELLYVGR